MTIDFRDAYFYVYVEPTDRKWLRFMWKGQYFQFSRLPQCSSPHTFTRLLKPALTHSRKLGVMGSRYIDDCLFIAALPHELQKNVTYALQLLVIRTYN